MSGPIGRTDNGGLAYSSTESKCLDFFTRGLLRDTEPADAARMFAAAWAENPRVAMQIVMNARDCRGGKGERKAVVSALRWLREHKPRTYAANLEGLVTLGRWKDLLELASMAEEELKGARLGGKKDILELEILANRLREDAALLDEMEETKARLEQQSGEPSQQEAEDGAAGNGDQQHHIVWVEASAGKQQIQDRYDNDATAYAQQTTDKSAA